MQRAADILMSNDQNMTKMSSVLKNQDLLRMGPWIGDSVLTDAGPFHKLSDWLKHPRDTVPNISSLPIRKTFL